jgi:signal transduction histidine kinase
VLGCLSLLEEALAEGGESGRYLEVAQDEARRAMRVVGQLRDLARQAREPAQHMASDLRTIASRVVAVVEKRCADQGVELTWDPPDVLPEVLADPDAIQQVFLNLTLNALDAMPGGGALRLAIETTADPAGVRATFADNGPGIDPDLAPRLFDSFVTNKPEGMGLGLYVSRNIVERHGGRIGVETQAGRGTTFSVWLPAHT